MAIKHYQVPLNEEDMWRLHTITSTNNHQAALTKAVEMVLTEKYNCMTRKDTPTKHGKKREIKK